MTEFELVPGRKIADIKIYALSTCGWCKRAKKFFDEHGIEYSYIDMDQVPQEHVGPIRAEQQKFNPRGSFPTIVINDSKCIVGYNEQQLAELAGE
ncbi:MAG: glutaredoxin family protein [Christensenellales bacterium]|jgi:glutaredoxin-like protein NrdH